MNHLPRLIGAAAVALAFVMSAGAAVAAEDPLMRVKKLAGTWYAVNDKGETTDQVTATFRVTSNGHSVIETMFPGTASEMINVYYRDVDHVLMTHYCAGGNQPILKLVPTTNPDIVAMEFVDITNMVTIDDEHMHEGKMQWLGSNRLKTEWRTFKRGRYTESVNFELVRKP